MKTLRNPYTWTTAILLALFALVTGCNTPDRPQGTVSANYNQDGTATVNAGMDVTTNVNVGLTGQYNVPTGDWSAGFTITFKDAVPADVVQQLVAAGGQMHGAREFRFPAVRAVNDPAYTKAVVAAGGSGVAFTLTPIK